VPRSPEEQEAWDLYLEQVRSLHPLRYEEVEAWAWAQLQARIQTIRREKVAA
jgi:hypothetical protein